MRIFADGDSKAFKALAAAVHEFYVPEKLNDKSHFAKRFPNQMETEKKKYKKGDLLEDGQPLIGPGRLTADLVKELGVLVGSNLVHMITNESTLDQVRNAVWAPYGHYMSTDENPQHQ